MNIWERIISRIESDESIPVTSIAFTVIPVLLFILDNTTATREADAYIPGVIYEAFHGNVWLISRGEFWRILTAPFIYTTPIEFGFCSMGFIFWGTPAEREYGRKNFFIVLTLTTWISSLMTALFLPDGLHYYGTTSAIIGVLCCYLAKGVNKERMRTFGLAPFMFLTAFVFLFGFSVYNYEVGAIAAFVTGMLSAAAMNSFTNDNKEKGKTLLIILGCITACAIIFGLFYDIPPMFYSD